MSPLFIWIGYTVFLCSSMGLIVHIYIALRHVDNAETIKLQVSSFVIIFIYLLSVQTAFADEGDNLQRIGSSSLASVAGIFFTFVSIFIFADSKIQVDLKRIIEIMLWLIFPVELFAMSLFVLRLILSMEQAVAESKSKG